MSYDAVDVFFKVPFKIKFKGQKITVRPMGREERITEKTLQRFQEFNSLPYNEGNGWRQVGYSSVGQLVDGYDERRQFVEVLSPYYNPGILA